jgi:hypothetical protein
MRQSRWDIVETSVPRSSYSVLVVFVEVCGFEPA